MTRTTRHKSGGAAKPVSVRLTLEERTALEQAARSARLTPSAYIRSRLFRSDAVNASAGVMRLSAAAQRELCARLLAKLGQTGLMQKLSAIQESTDLGLLCSASEASELRDVRTVLNDLLRELQDVRAELLRVLGRSSGDWEPGKPAMRGKDRP